jgi:hypothetical protein
MVQVLRVKTSSAVPSLILRTAATSGGLPLEVFDAVRAGILAEGLRGTSKDQINTDRLAFIKAGLK